MALGNVLISGAEVRDRCSGNRGAEHLLRSAASRVRSMGYQPAVTVNKVDFWLRKELSLKQYLGNPRLYPIDKFLPRLDQNDYATIKSFNGVLDASGYALGDPWGVHTANWLLRKYEQWQAHGLKIVALPQAYGPFEDKDVRRVAAAALSKCDLIYAREQESLNHLESLGIDPGTCRICPDITIGQHLEHRASNRERRLVVVPNWHLAEGIRGAAYTDCLVGVANWGVDNGYDVVGLLHEGQRDLSILKEVASRAPIRIISDLSGWDTKKYISESEVVVAARYHAVVAALTTGTPVVTHSWSHKYQQLLQDFGVKEWLVEPTDSTSTILRIESITSNDVSGLLTNRRVELAAVVDRMWIEVEGALSVQG